MKRGVQPAEVSYRGLRHRFGATYGLDSNRNPVGVVYRYEGLTEAGLKHTQHPGFHKTGISPEDTAKGYTHFCR